MRVVLFGAMGDNAGPPNDAFGDWRVEQRPVLLDKAASATPRVVPISDVARGVLRDHGVTAVLVERVSSLTGAESRTARWNHLGNTARRSATI